MSEIATIGTPASAVSAAHLEYVSRSLRAVWAGNQTLMPPEAARILKAGADVGAVVTKDMANAGVGILAGCDSMIAGFCVHDELAAMVRGGMTPLAALQTATLNPARYFGVLQTLGSVAPGKTADLVLLDNMSLPNLRRAVAAVAGRARLEASGGLSLGRARAVAEAGVDYLAVGALTHSAPVLDIAADLRPVE